MEADNLPPGYFYPGDVLAYREMVKKVPIGGTMVELGCYKGRSLCSVADIITERKINVFAVDTWHYAVDALAEFNENLKRFGFPLNNTQMIRMKEHSIAAAGKFGDKTIDLVFIDTPHDYPTVIADLRAWLPKVKPGGIIAGHDFAPLWPGVAKALNEMFGQVDLSANVNESDYCLVWKKRVGLNAVIGYSYSGNF